MTADPDRRLFAAHGFATYRAQLLEQRLWALLSTAFGDLPAQIPPEVLERLKRQSPDTFGALVRRLKRDPTADPALIEELERRVADRNYLAHRFFWDHREDIVDKERREFLIEELGKMAERFRAANLRLRDIYFTWLQTRGVTREQIAAALAAGRARITIT